MLRLQGNRLADILHTETEPTGFQPGHQAIEENTSITISNLSYKYAEHEPTILNDVNLKIAPGESIAITGPSGCGKSTLINLLLGVLKPTAGEIKIGEVDIAQSGYASLRSIVGTVMQDDVLFAGSIAENVTFFDPKPDFLWMKQCANVASIAAEISAMPMGFNTLVGDMGTVLSGGQKQRILLARALYKRPKILFLDEATSHLDVLKEKEVSTAIKALNITRLIVAHRPETISSADRVIELVGGKIVQDSKNPAPLSSSSKAMLETAA
jgi:ATP-binding cassette subfamily B protein RaxB